MLAMVVAAHVAPHTKLATTRWWHTTTLAEGLSIAQADEDDLYAGDGRLLERQDRIQKRSWGPRHLSAGALVPADLSSATRGQLPPAGVVGYSRDGEKGMLQVNYGLLTGAAAPGSRIGARGQCRRQPTLPQAVQRQRRDRRRATGDGGRPRRASWAIQELRETEGWMDQCIEERPIRALVEQGHPQLGLFDERNPLLLSSPDYPGERLVACW
ncbi:hypothetical protein [Variovorax sp. WS11]|uniref:hypothetical protein n=1 Tax=Variovorax sp. WS11 TaxID=1105204 RepID=UPI0013DB79AF|nr:hypothetical protein [Variovorax sp. WS11]NDZ14712.1 hypothetical protein [Variovorax sp. WS11]